jgi:hypothetical protein
MKTQNNNKKTEKPFCWTGRSKDIIYIGDAPNKGDMDRIRENLEYAIKMQKDYYKEQAMTLGGRI